MTAKNKQRQLQPQQQQQRHMQRQLPVAVRLEGFVVEGGGVGAG